MLHRERVREKELSLKKTTCFIKKSTVFIKNMMHIIFLDPTVFKTVGLLIIRTTINTIYNIKHF